MAKELRRFDPEANRMGVTGAEQGDAPLLSVVEGGKRRTLPLRSMPFVVGRLPESDLVLSQPYVSRRHAEILREGDGLVLRDAGSRHGTFVNAERVTERVLRVGDRIQFGSLDGAELCVDDSTGQQSRPGSTAPGLLAKLHAIQTDGSDLQKLRWFLQAARELNSAGAVDRVMASLLETTLALARVERGYVFLAGADGKLELALGMDAEGQRLDDAFTLSQTVMHQAVQGKDQFVVTDTLTAEGAPVPESMVAHRIRAVICIPLWQRRGAAGRKLLGLLYLDSRFEPAQFNDVDHELLGVIARDAAALVENAQLAVIEEQARQHKEELQIAAGIQQGLMAVHLPRLKWAEVQAHSEASKDVGGDFFDVITEGDVLSVALVDVSGKGISAAILASTLQGMLYVQFQAGRGLEDMAAATNAYLCEKNVGKYATMVLLRLHRDGRLEYINCGHIPPRLCEGKRITALSVGNVPAGLFKTARFEAATVQMSPGSRLTLVSDGFTDAEDAEGNDFGEERLDGASLCDGVHAMLERMRAFCGDQPLGDDCTIVQVRYDGC